MNRLRAVPRPIAALVALAFLAWSLSVAQAAALSVAYIPTIASRLVRIRLPTSPIMSRDASAAPVITAAFDCTQPSRARWPMPTKDSRPGAIRVSAVVRDDPTIEAMLSFIMERRRLDCQAGGIRCNAIRSANNWRNDRRRFCSRAIRLIILGVPINAGVNVMADTSITGDSPEAVALRLLELIATAEKKSLGSAETGADKDWILKTYGECLHAVRH